MRGLHVAAATVYKDRRPPPVICSNACKQFLTPNPHSSAHFDEPCDHLHLSFIEATGSYNEWDAGTEGTQASNCWEPYMSAAASGGFCKVGIVSCAHPSPAGKLLHWSLLVSMQC